MRDRIVWPTLVTAFLCVFFAASAQAYTQVIPGNPNIVIPEAGDPEYGEYDYVVYPTGNPGAIYPHRFCSSVIVTEDAYHIDWVVNEGGGGHILLKAHRVGEPTVFQHFEMGELTVPSGCVLVNITNDAVIEGEELSGRLTEINNGVACLGAGMFGTSPTRVVLRNLTARNPEGFFFGAWRFIFEVEIDNLNVLNARPLDGFLNLGLLIHHAGSFVVKDSTFTGDPSDPGVLTAGVLYAPYTWPDGYSFAEIVNNVVDMGTVWTGTIGILATEIGSNFPGGPHPGGADIVIRDNTVVHADIGVHAGGFGHYTVVDNVISAGKVGLMLFTYDDEDSCVAEYNSVHLDSSASADVLHNGAGVFGYSYSVAEIFGLTAVPGSLKNSMIRNNEFTGSADYGVYLADTSLGQNESSFNVFAGNDLSLLSAVTSQVMIGAGSHDNFFGPEDEKGSAGNSFGFAGDAGAIVDGHNNFFEDTRFLGEYPGWEPCGAGPGLFWLTETSYDNKLVATKLNDPPQATDICCQVRDQSGENEVPGSASCQKNSLLESGRESEMRDGFGGSKEELRPGPHPRSLPRLPSEIAKGWFKRP